MFKPIVNRRRFLWLGSAFTTGLLAAMPSKLLRSPSSTPILAAPQPLAKQAAVGFWQESHQLANFKSVSWQAVAQGPTPLPSTLVAADTLASGDRTFLTEGARVHIQGLRSTKQVQSLDVYAHYPAADGHDAQKVCVWSFRAAPNPSASAPISFVMPVSQTEGLKFSMVWQYRQADGSVSGEEAIAQFALDTPNMAKLQRGIYLLAGRDASTGQLPEWESYQLQVTESDRDDQRYQLSQIGHSQTASTLPYLLVAIDYPSPSVSISA